MVRILIIDDDEDDILILVEAIEHLWPEAICESSSINALWKNLINNPPPTLIFIDAFSSLGKDGLAALMAINQEDCTTVLVYTDESRTWALEEFKNLGAYDIVLKTGDYEALKKSLSRLNDLVFKVC